MERMTVRAKKFLMAVMVLLMTGAMNLLVFAADQDIVVIYTNDVHCGVDKNIGYAGLALYRRQAVAKTPYVTLVDAGDAIQGEPIGTLSEGGYLIDILNEMNYDFAVPGNHEYDYGMNRFLELAGKLNCGYYSSNFVDLRTGELVFPAYKMFQYGDTKVAFVGVTTPESFTKSTPKYFQDASGSYIYGFCEDESGQALYQQVQTYVDQARAQGADYVILVSHLGNQGVTEQWSSSQVLKNTTGINACIDGHSHEVIPQETVLNAAGEPVVLTQTGTKLKNIGSLTIHTDGSISSKMVSEVEGIDGGNTYTVKKGDSLSRIAQQELGEKQLWKQIYDANRDQINHPNHIVPGMVLTIPGTVQVQAGKAVDANMDLYIKNIQSQYEESLKTILGHSEVLLTDSDPETGKRAIRNAETNLGDLTADAYRNVLGAEIGLSNGGGIRSRIQPGDITYQNLLEVFPYGNMGCVIKASGQQIKDALEMSSRLCPDESGGFLQVSGLTYTIRTDIKSSVTTDEKQNFTGVSGEYRVADIMVNGEPLNLNRMYTVASHNYMLRQGGDGMTMFDGCEVVKDDTMVDVDILSAYIREYLNGTVAAGYDNLLGSGRILIK